MPTLAWTTTLCLCPGVLPLCVSLEEDSYAHHDLDHHAVPGPQHTLPTCCPRRPPHPPGSAHCPQLSSPSLRTSIAENVWLPLSPRTLNCNGLAILIWWENQWPLAQVEDLGRFWSLCTQQSNGYQPHSRTRGDTLMAVVATGIE